MKKRKAKPAPRPERKPPVAASAPRRGLGAAGLLEGGLLALAYAVEAIVFKAIQLDAMHTRYTPLDVIRAAAPDVAMAAIFALAFAALASLSWRPLRVAAAVIGYLWITAALVLNAASHGYFAATGSYLTLASLDVWVSNMGETNTVIAGEALTWKLPLAIAQGVFALAVAVGFRVGPIRRRLAARGAPSKRAAVVASLALVAVAAAALATPSLRGPRMALSRSTPLGMVADLARALASGDAASAEEEVAEAAIDIDQARATLALEATPGAPRPNVVVIMFESLNWKSSDVYTPGRNTTPFLAKLAPESLVVERQYAVVPHTSKAIVSILCGMTPLPGSRRIESTPGILPKQCLAHLLRSQGYATAYFQPATDFEERSQLVKNMGFQTFRGLGDFKTAGFEKTSYFGREDKIMLDPSLDWVDRVKGGPFFLAYMTLASHHNYVTPQSFPRVDYPEDDPDHENYLNAIRYIDDFVREVYAGFERRGLLENTVFFIVGDHGEAFAEHARRQHDLIMWEEGLRTAALIHGPKFLPKPGRIEGIRSHLDIVPTVVDLLGLEAKAGAFEGTSLLGPVPDDRELFHGCWFNNQCGAVREGPIKTIYHFESQPMEVYNDVVDELEKEDLAGKELYDEAFLDSRKKKFLDWKRGIERRHKEWEKGLAVGKVSATEPPIANRIAARFGDYVEIVGYEIKPAQVAAGGDLRAKYVFKCLQKPPSGTELFVHVLKAKGGYINADHEPVGGAHPIRQWKPGEFITDEHMIHIPADWAGERARVAIGFWNEKTDKRYEVAGKDLVISDNRLVLVDEPVTGDRARVILDDDDVRQKIAPFVSAEAPAFATPVGDLFGGAVELVGVTVRRSEVKLAGTVEADYVFRAVKPLEGSWKLVVALVPEEAGGKAIKGDHDPIGGLYPPQQWRAGEYVLDRHSIHIDMYKSKVGKYGLWLGFETDGEPVPVAGESRTDGRQRVYLGEVTINPRTERQ